MLSSPQSSWIWAWEREKDRYKWRKREERGVLMMGERERAIQGTESIGMEREKLSRKWMFTEASTLDSWFNERDKKGYRLYISCIYAQNCNNICNKQRPRSCVKAASFQVYRIKVICVLYMWERRKGRIEKTWLRFRRMKGWWIPSKQVLHFCGKASHLKENRA